MKKFATLLPNIWLAKTPQPLAVRRLGIGGKGGISEIKLECLFHKKAARELVLYGFFIVLRNSYYMEESCDTQFVLMSLG
ncbi:hypothetical protein CN563_10755 [Bacillus sp. AFS026049]|nr:hypothetical protein CN563_10755 [Bacillus sp. AFS026049]